MLKYIEMGQTNKGIKMEELQVGDVVDMFDGSYCFGIQHGKYSMFCDNSNGDRLGLTVVETGLDVVAEVHDEYTSTSGEYSSVCDILVTDNKGGYWFTQSRFVNLVKPVKHTVTIDDKTIEISDKLYQNLKKQLLQ